MSACNCEYYVARRARENDPALLRNEVEGLRAAQSSLRARVETLENQVKETNRRLDATISEGDRRLRGLESAVAVASKVAAPKSMSANDIVNEALKRVTPLSDMESDRLMFEDWAKKKLYDLTRNTFDIFEGGYLDAETHSAWYGWSNAMSFGREQHTLFVERQVEKLNELYRFCYIAKNARVVQKRIEQLIASIEK